LQFPLGSLRSHRALTYVYRYTMILLLTFIWGTAACLIGAVDRTGEGGVWAARRWVHWILRSCRVEVECLGLDAIDPSRPCVFMSNHQSVFDVAAIAAVLPVSFRFVAKRELVWIPVFGWALWLCGHVIVDRSRHDRSIRNLDRAAERVRQGVNVIIFPEGTRSDSGAIGPLKSGGFHLALRAGVPVVPVSVSGSRRITPKHSLRIESGRIRVHFGSPIPTEGLGPQDREALKREVRAAIVSHFDPAFPEAPGASA